MGADDLLIVAGEASGDLHGARLLSALAERRPELRPFGLGGDEMAAAGLDPVAHSSEIAVIGVVEALRVLRRAHQIFHLLLAETERRQPRVAVLIDSPDFNLRLAKALAERGVRVVYFISPQVWAWRSGRVKTIKETVARMLVVLPFEVDFYRRYGVEAVHVGHPLVDEVPRLPQVWDTEPDPDPGAHTSRGGASAGRPYRIALLPGSRRSEVEVLLPILLGAAARLGAELDCRFSLVRAPNLDDVIIDGPLARAGIEIEIIRSNRFAAIAASHLAICAAGTATLEVGLLRTPMVVTHRVSNWTYLLGRSLVNIRHSALVNLILERDAVPELLQWRAKPKKLAATAAALLRDRERIAEMRTHLATLRQILGPPGARVRAAEEVLAVLD